MATPVVTPPGSLLDQKLKKSSPGKIGGILFGVMLLGGIIYIWTKLANDLSIVHSASVFPYILLGWLIIGAAVILLSPDLVRRVGRGLARDLDLPAGRVAAEVLPPPGD